MDMNPSPSPAVHLPHRTVIQQRTPQWLRQAPATTMAGLQRASRQSERLAGLQQARLRDPATFGKLQAQYVAHRELQERVSALHSAQGTLQGFALPRLTEALKQRFGLDLDVRQTWLLHASHARIDGTFNGAAKDPIIEANRALRSALRPLLDAALQNFRAEEAEPGALDQGKQLKAGVFSKYQILGHAVSGTQVDLAAHQFAALARELDLGGQYQKHLEGLFDAEATALLQSFDRSSFILNTHLARLQQRIDAATHQALMRLASTETMPATAPLPFCHALRLWDTELVDILAIFPERRPMREPQPVTVYIPEDPHAPLTTYASVEAFHDALRGQLFDAGYRRFFSRFVPARQRARLMARIERQLFPEVWQGSWLGPGYYASERDPQAQLPGGGPRLSAALFEARVRRKLAVIRDDALFQGVPTAEQDRRSHEERMAWWRDFALNALNVAGFFVPLLGEAMLVVTLVQLGQEIYEGIESWEQGEKDQALAYLADVLQNVALLAATAGTAAEAGHLPAVEVPEIVRNLERVEMPDGQAKLWKPDLKPFAHDIILPSGLKADASGLIPYQGKRWLVIDERPYAVRPASDGQGHVLEHPHNPDSYAPRLRHNGDRAWLHALEEPGQMQGLMLLRRLGYLPTEFPHVTAGNLLRVSGVSEAALRQAITDSVRPPALLADTAERFSLYQQLDATGQLEHFQALYQASQSSPDAVFEALQRQLPSPLPRAIAEELLAHASSEDRTQLHQGGKLPLRLAEEARIYSQQVRLARAYEGLYLTGLGETDTARLALHGLQRLPDWPADLRLELRDAKGTGPLLDSVGEPGASWQGVVIRTAEGYLVDGLPQPPATTPTNLFDALASALPAQLRQAWRLSESAAGTELQNLLGHPPLPRRQARTLLGMQPVKPGFRSPMRLADGRLGYPLSGHGHGSPFINRESLLDKIRLLEFEDLHADELLQRLQDLGWNRAQIDGRLNTLLDEQQQLRACLQQWAQGSAAIPGLEGDPLRMQGRTRLAESLWQHWQLHCLPEVPRGQPALLLDGLALEDFPADLPVFMRERVSALRVSNPLMPVGAPALGSDDQALQRLLGQFPDVHSLEMHQDWSSQGPFLHFPNLLQQVARAMPELTELRLTHQDLLLTQHHLDALRPLHRLRHLDLSGNRFNPLLRLDLSWMRVERLTLERTGLDSWPEWLGALTHTPLRELSVAHNRISALPERVLDNPAASHEPLRVDLRGNPLTSSVLQRLRLSEQATNASFTFELDIPASLQVNLDRLLEERRALSEAIEMWVNTSTSGAPASAANIAERQRIGQALLDYWHGYSRGLIRTPLILDAIDLAQFPRRLPAFMSTRVRALQLYRVTASAEQLDALLNRFPALTRLQLDGHVTPLAELPRALERLPALDQLSLCDQGLEIDQAAIDRLARLPALEILELDGNRLGLIEDASALRARNLRWLSLRNMQLDHWPQWLVTLPYDQLEALILDRNHLTTIPEALLANPRNRYHHCDISLLDNPLSHESLLRAHTSEAYNRAYSFQLELPEDIRNLEWSAPHDSDSPLSDSDTSGHLHSPASRYSSAEPDLEAWIDLDTPQAAERRQAWLRLAEQADSHRLLELVEQLRHTADYRIADSRTLLIERVWQVLAAADQDAELRAILNAMADEPLQQLRNEDTCHDGIRLAFNQIEVQVFTRQSLQAALPAEQRGSGLLRLLRRLYRLQALDDIARQQAMGRDEAEVRLAYRLRWASELDLPVAPQRMLYQTHANLRAGELEEALTQVRSAEQGSAFLDYAAGQAFWTGWLREAYAPRFAVLEQSYRHSVEILSDTFDSLADPAFETAANELKQAYERSQQALVRELTNQQLSASSWPDPATQPRMAGPQERRQL